MRRSRAVARPCMPEAGLMALPADVLAQRGRSARVRELANHGVDRERAGVRSEGDARKGRGQLQTAGVSGVSGRRYSEPMAPPRRAERGAQRRSTRGASTHRYGEAPPGRRRRQVPQPGRGQCRPTDTPKGLSVTIEDCAHRTHLSWGHHVTQCWRHRSNNFSEESGFPVVPTVPHRYTFGALTRADQETTRDPGAITVSSLAGRFCLVMSGHLSGSTHPAAPALHRR